MIKKLLLFGSFILFVWNSSAQQLEEYMDEKTEKYGFKDSETEKIVVPAKYNYVGFWEENNTRMLVSIAIDEDGFESKHGYLDEKGNEIIPLIYSDAYAFSEGLALVYMDDEEFGYIDVNGKFVLPKLNERFQNSGNTFKDGLVDVYNHHYQAGFMDKNGKIVIECQFDGHVGKFYDDRAWVAKGDEHKYGFIDKTGKLVVPFIYDHINDFDPEVGLACVGINEKYGFINKDGEVVIPLIYNRDADFSNGEAYVEDDDGFHLINTKGERIK